MPATFFFHNPKAGGTAITNWLRTRYSERETSPLIVNDRVGHAMLDGRYEQFRGYRFYAGHYGRDIFDSVSKGHAPVTNFRDPLQRLISLYNYFRFAVSDSETVRTDPAFACVRAAKNQDIEGFLLNDDSSVSLYTCNHHVRQLTRSGFEDDADLESATALVDAMPWYHVAEQQEASLRWAALWLATPLPALPRENQTPAHPERVQDVSDDLRAAVRARNRLDQALYDHAVLRLSERAV